MRNLSCGVVGVGQLGQHHVRIYKELREVDLVGIYDTNPERMDEIARTYGTRPYQSLEELLNDVEAISLVVPTSLHFEIGRTEYMRAKGYSYADFEKTGLFLVITEAHVQYRRPAAYDTEITIKTRLKDSSHAQVTFEYNIENGAEVLCEGWTRLACTDRDGKLKRIPEYLQNALKGEEK